MLLALTPISLWAAAPAPDAIALIATLGRPAPSSTPFAEARFMRVLDQPLIVSGELSWLGGDTLRRRVDAPRKETSTIANGEVTLEREGKSPRTFSLQRAPQLKVLLDSFVALLGGDASRLGDAFVVDLKRQGTQWTITLTPGDAKVARQIGRIVVNGAGNEPRCMHMEESDGDVAIDLLGALAAQMPAAPTREGWLALCTAAP